MRAALNLPHHVAPELVLEVLDGLAVYGLEMRDVGHVVEHFDGMHGERAQVVDLPAHPLGIVPFRMMGQVVVGLAAFGVVPHPDDAVPFDHPPRAHAGGLGNRPVVVGDVIALAVRAEAPAVIGAADRVSFDLLTVLRDVGGRILRQMRAHVGAVRIEQHDAPALAPIEGHVLAEIADRQRPVAELRGIGYHEPAAREGEFAEAVVFRRSHLPPPLAALGPLLPA